MRYAGNDHPWWELEAWFVEHLGLNGVTIWVDYDWTDNEWMVLEVVS